MRKAIIVYYFGAAGRKVKIFTFEVNQTFIYFNETSNRRRLYAYYNVGRSILIRRTNIREDVKVKSRIRDNRVRHYTNVHNQEKQRRI